MIFCWEVLIFCGVFFMVGWIVFDVIVLFDLFELVGMEYYFQQGFQFDYVFGEVFDLYLLLMQGFVLLDYFVFQFDDGC